MKFKSNRTTRFQIWLKTQKKYRKAQQLLSSIKDSDQIAHRAIFGKVDMLRRRLLHLNRKWRLGIAASLLTAWLAFTPSSVQAQGPVMPQKINVNKLSEVDGFEFSSEDESYFSTLHPQIVGDINNDGINDLTISYYYANWQSGDKAARTYVIFGRSEGFASELSLADLTEDDGFVISTPAQVVSAANAGDINNDGIDDMILGSPNADDRRGHIYVIFGSETISALDLADLHGSKGFLIRGNNTVASGGNYTIGDQIGYAVSGNGDVNNDGIDDLAFGAYKYLGYRGASFVVFGKTSWADTLQPSGIGSDNGFKVFGSINNSVSSGRSVEISGDFSGDGIDDLLIGESSTFYGGTRRGALWIMLGKETGLTGTINIGDAQHRIKPSLDFSNNTHFSEYVTYIPDFNGDGINDVLIASPNEHGGSQTFAYVLFGGLEGSGNFNVDNLDGTNGFGIMHSGDERLTESVSAGDFNDDGLSDIAIKVGEYAVSVIYGNEEPLDSLIDLLHLPTGIGTIIAGDSRFYVGSASIYGDITGDGIDDLVISDNGQNRIIAIPGRTTPELPIAVNSLPDLFAVEDKQLIYKVPSGIFASQDLTLTYSVSLADGSPLPGWLTFDTDTLKALPKNGNEGILNLKVTATDTQGNSAFTGLKITVLDEKSFNLGTRLEDLGERVITIENGGSFYGAGQTVAGIGDINGDGVEDVLIGAPASSINQNSYAGAAIVVFGNKDLLASPLDLDDIDGSNGFVMPGASSYNDLGSGVYGAGDVNGDGKNDFIVSSYYLSYVIFGADSYPNPFDLQDLDGTNGFVVYHTYSSVSAYLKPIGDFNNDGFDDLITGPEDYYSAALIFGGQDFPDTLDISADLTGKAVFVVGDGWISSLAGVGDINGDGFDDLSINSYAYSYYYNYKPKVTVVFGEGEVTGDIVLEDLELDGSNGFVLDIPGLEYYGYYSMFSGYAGDLNSDGIDDFYVNRQYGDYGTGVIVVFGSDEPFPAQLDISEVDGANGFWFADKETYDFGNIIQASGDFNHDGHDDLLIGSGETTWVLFSSDDVIEKQLIKSEFSSSEGFSIQMDEGYSVQDVSSVDFNGDGISDLVIGIYGHFDQYPYKAEKVFVVLGDGPIPPEVANPLSDMVSLEDSEFSILIPASTFSDANTADELSFSISLEAETPDWLVIDSENLTVSGKPLTDADAGKYTFKVTALDEDGLTAEDEFDLVVTAVNDAPVLSAIEDQETSESDLLTFAASATDEESTDLQFSLDAASSEKGMSVDMSLGTFTWTPSSSQAGTYEVTMTVSDGELSDSELFTIVVIPGEDVETLGLIKTSDVRVFPNPTSKSISVALPENYLGSFNIEILDSSGKLIKLQNGADGEGIYTQSIDIESLPKGLYFVRINMDNQTEILKIIKH